MAGLAMGLVLLGQVSAIQFAVTVGAVSGGLQLDTTGAFGAIICSVLRLMNKAHKAILIKGLNRSAL
jgi:hypothetical protein